MQQLSFDFVPERRYQRRPVRTSELRFIYEKYIRQNLPGEEVAEMIGRSYLSFRQIVQRHPHLHKGKKGGVK